ncbi:MAG: hypothetical protein HY901_37455 [Deltaproteobacteria bacterium]|nr:hypothetical protein [Deltaproteobacteria bacterium]
MKGYLLVAGLALMSCKQAPDEPSHARPLGREACVDRWLKAQDLNPYGDPRGTTYAGGNPLFDERTGVSEDRVERVTRKHPEAGRACAVPDGGR